MRSGEYQSSCIYLLAEGGHRLRGRGAPPVTWRGAPGIRQILMEPGAARCLKMH